jgi:hypothetical protein
MTKSRHPCWVTAMHEASHIAVYLKLGGKWGADKRICINQNFGGVALGGLWDFENGHFLDCCVYAAGLAADRIQGLPSLESPRSDLYELKSYAIDYQMSEIDEELVVSRVEKWLRKHHRAIEYAAEELIKATDKKGNVPATKAKKIVEQMRDMLNSGGQEARPYQLKTTRDTRSTST